MSHLKRIAVLSLALAGGLWLAGCPSDQTTDGPAPSAGEGAGHDHDHPSEGPHHGDLVELGGEQYHGEIVHGDGGLVTVYILDGTAKNVAPIAATEVTINVQHGGAPEQFKLPASPDTGDPAGKSSRFMLTDADLSSHLDEEGVSARLVVEIDGTPHSGPIEHHHGHDHEDGHDHAP